MRYWIFAILSLAVVGLGFAQDMDACGTQETSCKASCCSSAGGAFSETADAYVCNTEDNAAITQAYDQCSLQCNVGVMDCVAPGSGCSQGYSSCVGSCMGQGQSLADCDSQCFDAAGNCMAQYMNNPPSDSSSSCCGPSFLLGLLVLGAFYRRK
ncbi:hypothetical protein H0O00_00840 [Candidatus Micrarchaeota archaeon]|nr:hypothetical protein [Candidatus Micrarchaeota archaeon]